MPLLEKFIRSNFFIKLRSWEYWPFGIVKLPAIVYYLWLSLRARSFIFFSASNPGITMGGMFGESKYDVLMKIPEPYIPRTILITLPASVDEVLQTLKDKNLQWPLIFKPDMGERGFMVKRIESAADVSSYLSKLKFNFLAQELIDLPLEFGVFYIRFPSRDTGEVTSIVMKEMLKVTGDGITCLKDLILKKDRAKLQWQTLKQVYRDRLTEIPSSGQVIELISVGNHCLGTKFLNANHFINPALNASFDRISKQIEGFYFGRFDLRCASIADLDKGIVKIMELNGCGAEPAHIYHPGYPLRKALAVLFLHWKNIFIIANENVRHGVQYTSFKEALMHYRRFKAAIQEND